MSGGGRCNFTNMYVEPAAYLSQNPHFANLRWRAIPSGTLSNWLANMVLHGMKTLGQLFCDDSAEQIVNLLLSECEKAAYRSVCAAKFSASNAMNKATGYR